MELVLAIDIGGTKLAVGAVDRGGVVHGRAHGPTEVHRPAQDLLERLRRLADQAVTAAGATWSNVVAAGVGVPGPLDVAAGKVVAAPNAPNLAGFPLRDGLVEVLGRRVYLENDANAAAVGEWLFGAGRGCRHMVYLTISTGIGGGIIADGRVYGGGHGNAGEIGHMLVERDGRLCGCGRRGCLEAYASGTAIARRAESALAAGAASVLQERTGGNPRAVTSRLVAEAAGEGDALARQIWDEAMSYLGETVGNLMNALNPERIVLGGGVSQTGELLLDPVREVASRRALVDLVPQTEICLAKLGPDSGMIGAAAVGWTHWRDDHKSA